MANKWNFEILSLFYDIYWGKIRDYNLKCQCRETPSWNITQGYKKPFEKLILTVILRFITICQGKYLSYKLNKLYCTVNCGVQVDPR